MQAPPDPPRPVPTPARVAVASPRTLHYSPSEAPEGLEVSGHSSDSDVDIGAEGGAALPRTGGKEIPVQALAAEKQQSGQADPAMSSEEGKLMTDTEADEKALSNNKRLAGAEGTGPSPVAPTANGPGSEIPSLTDKTAPRFQVGDHHISQRAIKQRANRVFTPRADGSLKVSKEIFDEWKQRGRARRTLEEIFKQCGYDPDFWTSFMMLWFWFVCTSGEASFH